VKSARCDESMLRCASGTLRAMSRRLNRSTRWATLLALLLATLAPSVAHALRHVRGETMPWSVLCSASGGMRRIQMPGDPAPGQAQHAFDHCASCVLHVPAAPPPPAPADLHARSDLAHTVPAPLQPAPRALHTWVSAQPRAPPVC
jgi:hypothetical protein